jgi:hypothetical protein
MTRTTRPLAALACAAGSPVRRSHAVSRLARASFSARGGASGLVDTLGRAFVTVEHRA